MESSCKVLYISLKKYIKVNLLYISSYAVCIFNAIKFILLYPVPMLK